jgi:predicted ATPase
MFYKKGLSGALVSSAASEIGVVAAQELRRRQLAALVTWFLAGARSQPAAVAFEDLHWTDPTSLDFMPALAERGAQAPLFILATARPEFRPPWSLRSHHSVIALSPLDRADVARMVGELAARHALSREVVEGVAERTGGVPLFVEEVTRLLLERGEAGGLQAIPPTLQQSLAARLDRLGEAREVAQIGAVLGRDFSYALLAAVAAVDDRSSPPPPRVRAVLLARFTGEDEAAAGASPPLCSASGMGEGDHAKRGGGGYTDPALQSALDRLAGADLLYVEGAGAQATYRFKHALIQDAAYDSLLKSRRQALHRRAAEVLRDDRERAAAEPEVIAHHFTQAGLDDVAIEWWGRAGDQALRRSAFQEAIAHLGKAIAMADKAAAAPAATTTIPEPKPSRRVKLQTSYARAVLFSKGWAADETKAAFERVGDLATGAKLPAERFPALYGQTTWRFLRGDYRAGRDIAERFLREAEAEGRVAEAGVARRLLGFACTNLGDLAEARSQLELALNNYDAEHDPDVREKFGWDTGVASRAFLAQASWHLGDLQRARRLIDEAIRLGRELNHLPSVVQALLFLVVIEGLRNDLESVVEDAENLSRIGQQHGMELFVTYSRVYLSWAQGRPGDARSSADELRKSLADYTGQGNRQWVPWFLGLLAEREAAAGDAGRALATIDEGLATAQEGGQQVYDAYLHRLRGDILMKRDPADPAPAEEAFQTAIAIARRQGSRSFGLQAALALAKLYQSTGRPADAHAVLAPALEGFSPTPEMPQIAEAQALLAALAETNEVKAVAARRQQRRQLHVAYGNALIAARGFGAPETTEAFARAQDSASADKGDPERLAADYGLWASSYVRGELPAMRARAAAFLSAVEARPESPEACVAHRLAGSTHWFAGEYDEAQEHLERALALFQPGRDDDLAFRFGQDVGVAAMLWLAMVLWPLGDIARALSLVIEAQARIAGLDHIVTHVYGGRVWPRSNCCAATSCALRPMRSNLRDSHASMISRCGARSAKFSRARRGPGATRPAGSKTCAAALNYCAIRTFCMTASSRLRWPEPKPVQAISTAQSPSSTRPWRRRSGLAIVPSTPNCIASAARCC